MAILGNLELVQSKVCLQDLKQPYLLAWWISLNTSCKILLCILWLEKGKACKVCRPHENPLDHLWFDLICRLSFKSGRELRGGSFKSAQGWNSFEIVLLLLVKVRMAVLSQAKGPARLQSSSVSGPSLVHMQGLNSYYVLPASTSLQFSNFLSLRFFYFNSCWRTFSHELL